MTGPSSIQGAQVIRLKKANCTVVAHSQVRDRNSVQPSAMSRQRARRHTAEREARGTMSGHRDVPVTPAPQPVSAGLA
jgi:hypothetical protein